jgi:hypothetical protein
MKILLLVTMPLLALLLSGVQIGKVSFVIRSTYLALAVLAVWYAVPRSPCLDCRKIPSAAYLWLMYAALAGASAAWSSNPAFTTFAAQLILPAVALFLLARSSSPRQLSIAWIILCWTALPVVGWSMLHVPGGLSILEGGRMSWPFGKSATTMAAALLLLIPMAIATSTPGRRADWFASGVLIGGLILTGSRSAILGATIVGLCWTITQKGIVRYAPAPFLLIWAILGAYSGRLWAPPERIQHWGVEFYRFFASPILGQGHLGSFPHFAHSDYVQAQADLGLVGLALFVATLLAILWGCHHRWLMGGQRVPKGFVKVEISQEYSKKLFLRTAALAGIVAIIIMAGFDFPLSVPGPLALFALAAGTGGNDG